MISQKKNIRGSFRFCDSCSCQETSVMVKSITIVKSQIFNTFVETAGFIIGLFAKPVLGKDRADVTHESLLIELHCDQCFEDFQLTIDRDDKEERMRFGEFMNTSFRFQAPTKIEFKFLTLNDVREIFNNSQQREYHFIRNNCSVFAREFLEQCKEQEQRLVKRR